jgi:DnaJ-class molecular chaperone
MRCETCGGEGVVRVNPEEGIYLQSLRLWLQSDPCSDCGGSGITHCCEGDRAIEALEDDDV